MLEKFVYWITHVSCHAVSCLPARKHHKFLDETEKPYYCEGKLLCRGHVSATNLYQGKSAASSRNRFMNCFTNSGFREFGRFARHSGSALSAP